LKRTSLFLVREYALISPFKRIKIEKNHPWIPLKRGLIPYFLFDIMPIIKIPNSHEREFLNQAETMEYIVY